nr:hypothetical transcript [Hymenolepis microstoma]
MNTSATNDSAPLLNEKASTEQTFGDVMQQFLQMPLLLVLICLIFVFALLIIGWISSLILLSSHYKKKLRLLKKEYEINSAVHQSSIRKSLKPIEAFEEDNIPHPYQNSSVSKKNTPPKSENPSLPMSAYQDSDGENILHSSRL